MRYVHAYMHVYDMETNQRTERTERTKNIKQINLDSTFLRACLQFAKMA